MLFSQGSSIRPCYHLVDLPGCSSFWQHLDHQDPGETHRFPVPGDNNIPLLHICPDSGIVGPDYSTVWPHQGDLCLEPEGTAKDRKPATKKEAIAEFSLVGGEKGLWNVIRIQIYILPHRHEFFMCPSAGITLYSGSRQPVQIVLGSAIETLVPWPSGP